ncbi:MAG: hypothetical protein H0X33_08230 [Taibaiella sp.]|nr:hypothetical protein [Taibaiella sp.]
MQQFNKHYLVPAQEKGLQKDLHHTVKAEDIEDAEDLFIDAKERLLDVNNWQRSGTVLNASFILTDINGKDLHRAARKGDYIRIEIQTAGTNTINGPDWLHIEAIEYDDYPDENTESFAVRVRPSTNPQNNDDATAHFFNDIATSTFVIERIGSHVVSSYHGRNESSDTTADENDSRSNMAAGRCAGVSGIQWKNLIIALIDDKQKQD